MSVSKLTDRTALTTTPANSDVMHVVDVSDTTGSAEGTSKKVTIATLMTAATGGTQTVTVHNESGATLTKGQAVYVTGATGGGTPTVELANYNAAATMPAIGLVTADIADNSDGTVADLGQLDGLDTSGLSEGDVLYVGALGALSNVKPQGARLIQNIGFCLKVSASQGAILIQGAGRTNDVPNIPDGQAWIGNAQGVATPTTLATVATTNDYDDLTNKPADPQVLDGQILEYITRSTAFANGSVEGEVMKYGAGTLVETKAYVYGSGSWIAVDADVEAKTKGLFAIALGQTPLTDGMLIKGVMKHTAFSSFAIGDTLYVSTTEGTIQNSAPTAQGEFVRVIGYALGNDYIMVQPDATYIELS